MLKYINKKAFTLVEVICSLGVFSIIFICVMSFDVSSLNMKKDIKTINNNVIMIEALKNNIIYKMTYEELEQLQTGGKFYINEENMTFDKINTDVMDVFSDMASPQQQYIELSFIKCEFKVYSLRLLLHAGEEKDILEIQYNFYKGDHK